MSDFFSTDDLAELQEVGTSAMAGTLVIRRQTNTPNGMGGSNTTYPAVGTVPCHIWRTKEANEMVAGAMVRSKAEWYVAVPVGTDIREATDWGICDNTTYQIVHVPAGITWKPHLRCEAITYNRELKDDEV
jgi:hypothetical protein